MAWSNRTLPTPIRAWLGTTMRIVSPLSSIFKNRLKSSAKEHGPNASFSLFSMGMEGIRVRISSEITCTSLSSEIMISLRILNRRYSTLFRRQISIFWTRLSAFLADAKWCSTAQAAVQSWPCLWKMYFTQLTSATVGQSCRAVEAST